MSLLQDNISKGGPKNFYVYPSNGQNKERSWTFTTFRNCLSYVSWEGYTNLCDQVVKVLKRICTSPSRCDCNREKDHSKVEESRVRSHDFTVMKFEEVNYE